MKLFAKPLLIGAPLLGLAALFTPALSAAPFQDAGIEVQEAVELPTARSIVDKYLKVTGTADFAPKYKSQRSVGTIEIVGMGIKGTTETITMKPSFTLSTVEMAMVGKVRTGDNGKVAWRIHPMMGEQILEGAELAQLRNRNAPFVSEFKNEKDFEVMKTIAREKFEKKDCYKIRFVEKPYKEVKGDPEETKEIREFFEFYEVESGLLAGMTMVSATPQGDMPSTVVISDYKKFGEGLAATKTLIKAAGMEILALTTELEFNTIEDASIFALPPEIEVLLEEEEPEEKAGGDGE